MTLQSPFFPKGSEINLQPSRYVLFFLSSPLPGEKRETQRVVAEVKHHRNKERAGGNVKNPEKDSLPDGNQ